MKRPLIFLLFLLISFSLFATGAPDLTVVSGRNDIINGIVLAAFHQRYPGVTVEFLLPNLESGSTVTMDSRQMAGDETHVYADFMGRVGRYATPDLALDFNKYMTDQDDFNDGALDPVTVDGKLLALPLTGGGQGMCVNLAMLEDIGYSEFDFEDWTLIEFYEMAEVVKQKYGGDKWITGIFFGNRSGDYLWMNWVSTFGAEMYHAGDYSQTVINSPAGRKTFAFWLTLRDMGYVRKDVAIAVDDDFLADFGMGNYLMAPFYPSWVAIYQNAANEQGIKDAYFPYKFVEFPRARGVNKVPAAGSMAGVTAFQNDDPLIEEQSAYLAWLYTSPAIQEIGVELGSYPTRKSITFVNDTPTWRQLSKIVRDNGMLDLGLTQSWFSDVRSEAFPRVQKMLNGEMTPAQAVADYAAAVNAILQK